MLKYVPTILILGAMSSSAVNFMEESSGMFSLGNTFLRRGSEALSSLWHNKDTKYATGKSALSLYDASKYKEDYVDNSPEEDMDVLKVANNDESHPDSNKYAENMNVSNKSQLLHRDGGYGCHDDGGGSSNDILLGGLAGAAAGAAITLLLMPMMMMMMGRKKRDLEDVCDDPYGPTIQSKILTLMDDFMKEHVTGGADSDCIKFHLCSLNYESKNSNLPIVSAASISMGWFLGRDSFPDYLKAIWNGWAGKGCESLAKQCLNNAGRKH